MTFLNNYRASVYERYNESSL